MKTRREKFFEIPMLFQGRALSFCWSALLLGTSGLLFSNLASAFEKEEKPDFKTEYVTPSVVSLSGTGTVKTFLRTQRSQVFYIKLRNQIESSEIASSINVLSTVPEENDERSFASVPQSSKTAQELFAIFSPDEIYQAPTLAAEANKDLLGSEIMAQYQRDQTSRAFRISLRSNFYTNSRDSAAPIQPRELNVGVDRDSQKRMANDLRKYLILKGIPKFVFSREGTKEIGKAMDKTVDAVQNSASIKVASKDSKWIFNTGLNPINGKTHATYKNENWTLIATTNIRQNYPMFIAESKFGFQNRFTVATTYLLKDKRVAPTFTWALSNSTTTTLSSSLPIRGINLGQNVSNSISLSHSF